MNTRAEQERQHNGLTRREFLTLSFARTTCRPLPPAELEPAPGRIPLSALPGLPDGVLMRMVPVLRKGWTARIGETGVVYRGDAGQEGSIGLDSRGCMAAQLFDGIRTLEQVAAVLDAELAMRPGSGDSIVRETFLALAAREVYHPDRPPYLLNEIPPTEGEHAQ